MTFLKEVAERFFLFLGGGEGESELEEEEDEDEEEDLARFGALVA